MYNNTNIYKYIHNTCIFNCEQHVNYTTGYICFIDFSYYLKEDFLNDSLDFWHNQYLLTSLIHYTIVNKYNINNLIFLNIDNLHKATTIQYIMSEILGRYFAKVMRNQKIKLDDI